jgi:ABC-type lipoprotein export system ATPase subunit
MLTKLTIRNFKKFEQAEIELGKAVVFIGPNNSGKTTALQALALWDIGMRAWLAKRGGKASPVKRPGVAINRRDLISIPVPVANLLWHELHTRNVQKVEGATTRTGNIRVDVIADGVTNDKAWQCGFEFDYQNEESFVCRPVRLPGYEQAKVSDAKFSEIPEHASAVQVAYLPPMSGLTDREHLKQSGEIGFLIGQGRTAEVLRNLCYQVYQRKDKSAWNDIVKRIAHLFGATLQPPQYVAERSEITMEYEENATSLDLSSAGRGLQQTLLLLAHLYANPRTILLLDEPDAHLEILRQRQTYQLLTEVAEMQGSQIISASHSEVVLNEAAGRGKVIAFVGKPHTMNDRGSQVMKALTDIGWDQYYQAEAAGWLLCLEGSTDLSILRAFAQTLGHPAREHLDRPFVHYVSTNLPQKARDLFYGLREAKPDLVGIAIFDRLDNALQQNAAFVELMWQRRELENYFCAEDVLMRFARGQQADDLFGIAEREKREQAMREAIHEVSQALSTLGKPDPWSPDIKATDEFLDPLFRAFFKKLSLPLTFRKADYHELASLVPKNAIDPEIKEKLDAIVALASKAAPRA